MDKYLDMVRDDLEKLNNKSKVLFESWRDESAESFNEHCLDHVQRAIAKYIETVTPLCKHIQKLEKQMQQQLEKSKRR